MRLTRKVSGIVAAGGATALVVGAIGFSGGIGANFFDSAKADANINVGTLSCQLESNDPHVHVHNSTDSHTATITLDTIMTSTGSDSVPLKVRNTDSIPLQASWSITHDGTNPRIDPLPTASSKVLNPGKAQKVNIGFEWNDLINSDQGKTFSATYTVDCTEAPAALTNFKLRNGGTGSWNSDGTVDLNTNTDHLGSAKFFVVNPGSLAAQEPTFTSTGTATPFFQIRFSDGTRVEQYAHSVIPGKWMGTWNSALHHNASWTDLYSYVKNKTVTQVDVLVDSDSPGTLNVTCINYTGTPLFGTC